MSFYTITCIKQKKEKTPPQDVKSSWPPSVPPPAGQMYSCSLTGTALREVSATPRGALLLSLVLLSLCYHLVCMLNIQTAFSEHGSPHPCRKEENYQEFCHVEETYRRQTSKGICTSCTHHLHLFTPSVAVAL